MRVLCSTVAAVVLIGLGDLVCAGEVQTFGEPLSGLEPTPLADLLKQPEDGQRVCLEGTVSAVCQNRGCWLELKQGTASVHVTFQGYSFFVPKDSKGRAVRLEGRVSLKDPDPERVKHLREEGASESVAGRVSVVATGVELR